MGHNERKTGEFCQTSSVILARKIGRSVIYGLHHHKKFGALMVFGGHVELGESRFDAARREALEESGYDLTKEGVKVFVPRLSSLSMLGDGKNFYQPASLRDSVYKLKDGVMHNDSCYAFLVNGDPDAEDAEVTPENIIWMTEREIKNSPDSRLLEDSKETISQFDTRRRLGFFATREASRYFYEESNSGLLVAKNGLTC